MLACTVACERTPNTYEEPPPPEVTVALPVQTEILKFFDQNGETEAVNDAEVRARVKGFIEEIRFEPASEVKEGELLYRIERDTYAARKQSAQAAVEAGKADVGVAEAVVRSAEADQIRAKADFDREKRLLDGNAGSQADFDRAQAALATAEAAIESAKASLVAATADQGRAEADLAEAELNLGYTDIVAPIDGRITKTKVKKGNLVDNGSHLATVINSKQIFANFNISDRQLLQFDQEQRAKLERGETIEEIDWRDVTVLLRRETDRGFPFKGRLDYIDQNGIDPDTGTLALRALFDNPGMRLVPGMFVTVRVLGDASEVKLVPELALARDQRGFYVLAVGAEDKVEQVRVTVGERISGWVVISSGLNPDTRVVIDGLQRSIPGSKVSPITQTLEVDQETLMRGMEPPESAIVGNAGQDRAPTTDAEAADDTDAPDDATEPADN